MRTDPTCEEEAAALVMEFGEAHRQLIYDAITWLHQVEPTWALDEPIDKRQYIVALIEQVSPKDAQG